MVTARVKMPAAVLPDEMFGILLILLLLLLMLRVLLRIALDRDGRNAVVVLIDLADKHNIINVDNNMVPMVAIK